MLGFESVFRHHSKFPQQPKRVAENRHSHKHIAKASPQQVPKQLLDQVYGTIMVTVPAITVRTSMMTTLWPITSGFVATLHTFAPWRKTNKTLLKSIAIRVKTGLARVGVDVECFVAQAVC